MRSSPAPAPWSQRAMTKWPKSAMWSKWWWVKKSWSTFSGSMDEAKRFMAEPGPRSKMAPASFDRTAMDWPARWARGLGCRCRGG